MSWRALICAGVALGWLPAVLPVARAAAPAPGCPSSAAELYFPCSSCHGINGEGSEGFGAPALAGLPRAYIARQLRQYRAGARGAHRDDTRGQQMSLLAKTLREDAAIEYVACYIGEMAAAPPPPKTLVGSVKRGKRAYALCAACHGERGEGVAELDAPPIRQFADWYLRAQLHAYRAGWRAPQSEDDTRAAQMNAAAMALKSDREIVDLAAYIATLR